MITRDDIIECWCGAAGTYDELFCDDDIEDRCYGAGHFLCWCGGDFCVCHHPGEIECPGCEDCEPDDLWGDEIDQITSERDKLQARIAELEAENAAIISPELRSDLVMVLAAALHHSGHIDEEAEVLGLTGPPFVQASHMDGGQDLRRRVNRVKRELVDRMDSVTTAPLPVNPPARSPWRKRR